MLCLWTIPQELSVKSKTHSWLWSREQKAQRLKENRETALSPRGLLQKKEWKDPEVVGDYTETVSSGPHGAAAHMNSQRLCKFKQDKSQNKGAEVGVNPTSSRGAISH